MHSNISVLLLKIIVEAKLTISDNFYTTISSSKPNLVKISSYLKMLLIVLITTACTTAQCCFPMVVDAGENPESYILSEIMNYITSSIWQKIFKDPPAAKIFMSVATTTLTTILLLQVRQLLETERNGWRYSAGQNTWNDQSNQK